jgi:hypothetical protein
MIRSERKRRKRKLNPKERKEVIDEMKKMEKEGLIKNLKINDDPKNPVIGIAIRKEKK